MSKNLRQLISAHSVDHDDAQLIAGLTSIAASEDQILSYPFGPDGLRLDKLRVQDVLATGGSSRDNWLVLVDLFYRYRIAGLLRQRYADLVSSDLSAIWQVVLLALDRRAWNDTLQPEHFLSASISTIADRCAQHVLRRRSERVAEIDQSLQGTSLGLRWQMLTDLQQEEVLAMVGTKLSQLPPGRSSPMDRVSGSIGAVDPAFRQDVMQSLLTSGYDFSEAAVVAVAEREAVVDAGTVPSHDVAFDRLVNEACRLANAQESPPPGLDQAEIHLTEEDRQALDDLGTQLPEQIADEQRILPRSETALFSPRTAHQDTYLRATTVPAGERSLEFTQDQLIDNYNTIVRNKQTTWNPNLHFVALIGEGGQGVVYLVRRRGDDGFENLLALKLFNPGPYLSPIGYHEDARRIARMSKIVAGIHHPNVLDVIDFRQERGIRMMLMEWVDGYDLGRLTVPAVLERTRRPVDQERWEYVSDVVIKAGPDKPRFRPGVAVAIIRHCLAALEAMHDRNIVHGDIKPWNIMLCRNGITKLIDIGSAFPWKECDQPYHYTYQYVAPEVQQGAPYTPQSDLCSLGYVLIELLSGRSLFAERKSGDEMLEAKRSLPDRLTEVLPENAGRNTNLIKLCQHLVAFDPSRRFESARDADLAPHFGAHAFLNALVSNRLSVAWEHEIRDWLKDLG